MDQVTIQEMSSVPIVEEPPTPVGTRVRRPGIMARAFQRGRGQASSALGGWCGRGCDCGPEENPQRAGSNSKGEVVSRGYASSGDQPAEEEPVKNRVQPDLKVKLSVGAMLRQAINLRERRQENPTVKLSVGAVLRQAINPRRRK